MGKKVWNEYYRPQTIDEVILPQETKKAFMSFRDKNEVPNMLLTGQPGIGKTTVAKAILKELDYDYMIINGSDSAESGIDALRTKIRTYASSLSLDGKKKVVIIDECLDENETVRIGTVDDWKPIPLYQLEWGKRYPVVSFNMETGEFENDEGVLISEKEDDLYEVELEDGRKITLNAKHPFIVKNGNGDYIEKTIEDGLKEGEEVVVFENRTMRVKSITKKGVGKVRNLSVQYNRTFVTENGITTHNCDHLSHVVQPALRRFTEEFSSNCGFILTANYKNRIIEPLQSRMSLIDFTIPKEEKADIFKQFHKKVTYILDKEGVDYNPKVIAEFIVKYFPDFRKVINELQKYSYAGEIDSSVLKNTQKESVVQLYEIMKQKNFKEMRKWVAENIDLGNADIFRTLYETLPDYVEPQGIPNAIVILSEYDYKNAFVSDSELNVTACLVELMSEMEFL